MGSLAFTVPGEARGKGRPRATTIGGHARMFTDSRTASYENLVALAAREALHGLPPFDVPLNVSITVRLSPGVSVSRKRRAEIIAGARPIFGRWDLDNILKAICDGMNKVAFTDDRLIVGLTARKVGAETPGVDVVIEEARFADMDVLASGFVGYAA